MDRSARFKLNGSRIIHEAFEGEVVIVNLDSGRYYCLRDAGVDAWQAILSGRSIEEAAADLAGTYDAPASEIAGALEGLVADLHEQSLVVPSEAAAPEPPGAAGPAAPAGRPFEAPRLQVFTDMEDLLILDPIHEVDSAGWPASRTAAEQPRRQR